MRVSRRNTAALANVGAVGLLGAYLLLTAGHGHMGELWESLKKEGGFAKWAFAAASVWWLTHRPEVQPVGPAIWGLAMLAFGLSLVGKVKS